MLMLKEKKAKVLLASTGEPENLPEDLAPTALTDKTLTKKKPMKGPQTHVSTAPYRKFGASRNSLGPLIKTHDHPGEGREEAVGFRNGMTEIEIKTDQEILQETERNLRDRQINR